MATEVESHIEAQANESAAELLRQGWTAFGPMYDVGVRYGRERTDHEALDAHLGRESTDDERRALTCAIRERLDEGRPATASRPL